eukprot:scaffold24965_cov19-Tisochrysis_lutea.AAC.1
MAQEEADDLTIGDRYPPPAHLGDEPQGRQDTGSRARREYSEVFFRAGIRGQSRSRVGRGRVPALRLSLWESGEWLLHLGVRAPEGSGLSC